VRPNASNRQRNNVTSLFAFFTAAALESKHLEHVREKAPQLAHRADPVVEDFFGDAQSMRPVPGHSSLAERPPIEMVHFDIVQAKRSLTSISHAALRTNNWPVHVGIPGTLYLNKYSTARIIYVLIQIVAIIATLYILLGTILRR
jgi:hypothetical protein